MSAHDAAIINVDLPSVASIPLTSAVPHDAAIVDQRSIYDRAIARVNECQLSIDERAAADVWLAYASEQLRSKFIAVTEGKSAEEIKLFTLDQVARGQIQLTYTHIIAHHVFDGTAADSLCSLICDVE